MSTTTINYNLFKPELTDVAKITDINANWDTIDSELKARATLDSDGKVLADQLPDIDLSSKVSKSGDTLTGSLTFQNKTSYGALGKYRTINGKDYYVDFGCGNIGGKGCVSMQYMEGNTVKGRLEVSESGVSFYDENNNRTFLYRNTVVSASVES